MRMLALGMLFGACADGDPPAGSTGPADDSESGDRFDPATWPSTLRVDGRTVRVVAPSTYDGSALLPIWFSLHGYGGSADIQDAYWRTSALVDEGNYVLVLPDGTVDGEGARFWNATDLCCDFGSSGVDDLGFLLGVLDAAEAAFPVDADRVYVAGHSNGGFMSYRLACDAADRITAVASLAGSGFRLASACDPSEPVSILQVHGTQDATVPYAGGFAPGAEELVQRWSARNGCAAPVEGASLDLVDRLAGDETRVQTRACEAGTEVALWSLDAGHVPQFNDAWVRELWGWLSRQR